jgi:hypothetical protein
MPFLARRVVARGFGTRKMSHIQGTWKCSDFLLLGMGEVCGVWKFGEGWKLQNASLHLL